MPQPDRKPNLPKHIESCELRTVRGGYESPVFTDPFHPLNPNGFWKR